MDIGIGLDATLNLSFADQAALSQEAARLGHTSIWTPESTGQDAFQLCSQRWAASCQEECENQKAGGKTVETNPSPTAVGEVW